MTEFDQNGKDNFVYAFRYIFSCLLLLFIINFMECNYVQSAMLGTILIYANIYSGLKFLENY